MNKIHYESGKWLTAEHMNEIQDAIIALENRTEVKNYLDLLDYCACDGKTDDTIGLQKAIEDSASLGKKLLFPYRKTILISDSISLGDYCYLDFNHCIIRVTTLSNKLNYYAFVLNSLDGLYQDSNHPHSVSVSSVIKNLDLVSACKTSEYRNLKAFFIGADIKFENIRTFHFAQQVQWAEKRDNGEYCYLDYAVIDGWACNEIISNVRNSSTVTNLWQFHKPCQGDNLHFKNIHLPTKNSGSYENENMIFIKMSNGGIIEGLINGNIKLAYCKAFTIRNCHLELGIIDIDRSSVTMIDNYLRSKPGKNTIYLAGTEGNTDATMHQQWNSPITMINNTFVIDYFVHDYATKPVDIRLAAFDGDIVFINNKRFIYCGDINYHYESGIAVYVDELYKNHYINVPFAKISNKKLIQEKILSPFNSTIESIKKVINTTKYKGTINKNYYYALVAVVDENRKLATGFTKTAKVSTSSTGSNIIIPNFDFKGLDINFRIYKGTTSSKFEKVSDIANAAGIVDNEVSVNGFGWRDNSTGVVETYNECQGMEYINLGNNVLVYAKTLPTVGTWKVNDRCVLLGNGTSDNGGTYRYNGSTWVKL